MPTPEKVPDTVINVEIHALIRLRHRAIAEVVLPTQRTSRAESGATDREHSAVAV